MAREKNAVSIWFWLGSFVVALIPLVNLVMYVIWAFAGENQTRKNYFRAIFLYFLLMVLGGILLAAVGLAPLLFKILNGALPVSR
jgi:hypothetical protein